MVHMKADNLVIKKLMEDLNMWLSIVMVIGFVGFAYLYLDYVFRDFMGDDLEK